MDPRHKLSKQLDTLTVASTSNMSARTDAEATQTAANSGITPEGIKQKLEEGLGATHVEIEDMSGTSSAARFLNIVLGWLSTSLHFMCMRRSAFANDPIRWMRTDVRSHHRVAAVCKEDYTSQASVGQRRAKARDRGYPCMDAQMPYARRMGEEEAAGVSKGQPQYHETI